MASTKIPTVEEAVLKLLGEAKALTNVTVTNDREPVTKAEYVWLYKGEARRDFLGLGRRPPTLREDITLFFRILSVGATKNLEPARERAYELLEATETALREDMTLGGTVEFHRIPQVEGEPVTLDERFGFHLLFTLVAKTRI